MEHDPEGLIDVAGTAEPIFDLSPIQRGTLLHSAMDPGAGWYVVQKIFRLRSIDPGLLRRSWEEILARHSMFRTSFENLAGAAPIQRVCAQATLDWRERDWSGRTEAERDAALASFLIEDRAAGFPEGAGTFMRFFLATWDRDGAVLVWTYHHAVSDGWSMALVLRDLETIYNGLRAGAAPALAPAPQFDLFLDWLKDRDGSRDEAFWRAYLDRVPRTGPLLVHAAGGARDGGLPQTRSASLTGASWRNLQRVARDNQVTLNTLLLGCWGLLLSRYTGSLASMCGTVVSGRPADLEGVEEIVGPFINTVPVVFRFAEDPTLAGYFSGLQLDQAARAENEHCALSQIQEWAHGAGQGSLFDTLFVYENYPIHPRPEGREWVTFRPAGSFERPHYDIAVVGAAAPDRLEIELKYNGDEKAGQEAGAILASYVAIIGQVAERYDRRVSEIGLATAADEAAQHALIRGNRRKFSRQDLSLCALFDESAKERPDAIALVCGDAHLSYSGLDERSDRLAHYLVDLGLAVEERVGLAFDRSLDVAVSALAVLKAGGAFVPVDITYPADRVSSLLELADAKFVLTRTDLAGLASISGRQGTPIYVDEDEVNAGSRAGGPEGDRALSRNLAYIIFTSGSTGQPKGVMIEHHACANTLLDLNERFAVGPGDVLLALSSPSFDLSIYDIFGMLAAGGKTVIVDTASIYRPPQWLDEIRRHRVTLWNTTPGLMMLLLDASEASGADLSSLRSAWLSGDWIPLGLPPRLEACAPDCRLLSMGGATEVSIWSIAHEVDAIEPHWKSIPYGRPLANQWCFNTDIADHLSPPMAVGELHISGRGVARGYLGRPALTAERFVPDPYGFGGRRYRTGDMCRRWPDGVLELLGRIDGQVKIRGFRVELGEVEAKLAACPGVREALVTVDEDRAGERRLVAYLTPRDGEKPRISEIRSALARLVPDYMVPGAFVTIDALPLTPNGKIDRAALPAPDHSSVVSMAFAEPRGPLEAGIAAVWQELLGLERVGRHDSFFALGGHSLLAIQVVALLRDRLGIEIDLRDLFASASLAEFAKTAGGAGGAAVPAMRPIARDKPLPLSWAQQRLWFLSQLDGLDTAYHIPFGLRLSGAVDGAALGLALDRLVARHEALRTSFGVVDGEPFQDIGPPDTGFPLVREDVSGTADPEAALAALARAEAEAPFDLGSGLPVRGRLVRLGGEAHVLLVTLHHIVADGWSMAVLMRELGALYRAFGAGRPDPLPPLALQYADYAVWQRTWLSGEVLERQAAYWREALAGAPVLLELPADRKRPARQDFAGGMVELELDAGLTAALKALSRRYGLTLFMTLLSGWALVLSRLSGQRDVVVGAPIANRTRPEVEGLIGFFVNTLALRVELSGAPTVEALLARVKAAALGAQDHQDLPFEQVVELIQPPRSLAHSPLFQVMFAWQNNAVETLELPGLATEGFRVERDVAKFDLTLNLAEQGDRIVGGIEYARALFDRETVARYGDYLRNVLIAMAADPGQPASRVPLLGAAERERLLVEWNRTEAEHPRCCVHQLFEAQAARTPDAVALVFEDRSLSYGELEARSNRLAHHLRALGVGPDVVVGLCVERSLEMVVGLLGVLKAGGAYLPLDPAYPRERLAFMLQDAGVAVLVTHEPAKATLEGLRHSLAALATLDLDADADAIARRPDTPPNPDLDPQNLAYVIYTSGSTGQPKGVMVQQEALGNLVGWSCGMLARDPGNSFLLRTSLGFDASVWEIFVPLASGARLVLLQPDRQADIEYVVRLIQAEMVTIVQFVPALMHLFLECEDAGRCTSLKDLFCGGEELAPALVCRLGAILPEARLHNVYGPTEATVDASSCSFPAGTERLESAKLPIGRPIANMRLYVLDAGLEPVPTGSAGDLYVAGLGLARGYRGRPGLTADRFLPDPFGSAGGRMYLTGDRVRRLADGNLEFLERSDNQIKIRGHRVELGEVEAALLARPGVAQASVIVREDTADDKRLVAYIVGERGEERDLVDHVKQWLPDFMIPSAYVWLDALPLAPNGKIDRDRLPKPPARDAGDGFEPPRGPTEARLATVWADVLGLERVGRQDNFFDLGGHSLLATRVVSQLRQAGFSAALRDLFTAPQLCDLADVLDRREGSVVLPLVRADRSARLPLSFAQQRLWFLSQLDGLDTAYHIPFGLRLSGAVDGAALGLALDRLVARHEALRTSFGVVDGEPFQDIGPPDTGFPLVREDVSGTADPEAALAALARAEAEAPFDLGSGLPVRGRLVRLGGEAHVLLVTLHHIVADGWSMAVLMRELGALYRAFGAGRPDPLPPLALQYADYAVWQRTWLSGEVLERQAAYWREALAGAPVLLELPADRKRPARQDFAGGMVELELDAGLTAALKALSRRYGLTLFMTLLSGWALVLSRLSGQRDVVVGAPIANRTRPEVEGLIGFFVNTLALRVELSGAPTVEALLARVKAAALGAQDHQDLPFEQVVELIQPPRSLAHSPLFQVMFAWQNNAVETLELPGLATEGFRVERDVAKFDLTLNLAEQGDRIVGGIEYARALFDRETVARYGDYLRNVLIAMAADPGQPASRVPLLGAAERERLLVEWNRTEAEHPRCCVHQLFEAQAARTPDAVALVFEDRSLSYGELEARSNRLAHHLRALGVGPDVVVGLCVERSLEMVVGLLGVLKAGGAYLPLDPAYPRERLAFMLQDAGVAVLVTHEPAKATLEGLRHSLAALATLDLDADADAIARRPDTPPNPDLDPQNLAYVIYTSGSTGQPKGVMVQHQSVVGITAANARLHHLRPEMPHLQMASFSFDIFTGDLVRALGSGGRLVLAPKDILIEAQALLRLIEAERIAIGEFVPVVLRNLIDHLEGAGRILTGIETVICGADVWTPEDNRRLQACLGTGVTVINTYGVTEATIDTSYIDLTQRDLAGLATIPLGRPIANVNLYVLDAEFEPVPVGVTGEVHIGGVGVARGYLNRPGRTAERFVADPFGSGVRLYRTGDLGRYLPSGDVEFLGRNDFQVKIRGFRVELGEIEARLASRPEIQEAVVLAQETDAGDRRLVAYYTLADGGGSAINPEILRRCLLAEMMDHMVPAAYVRMEAMPLTPNGKLDRARLPVPGAEAFPTRSYEPPVGSVETSLAKVWAEVLGVARVGRHDNFFELGGHSLLAVRVVSRLRQAGIDVSLQALFGNASLASLATALQTPDHPPRVGDPHSPLVLIKPGSTAPLFLVHALGGGLQPYVELVARLATEQTVYGLHAYAGPASLSEAATVTEIARTYLAAIRDAFPDEPLRLGGWSLGGLIAFRMAQLAAREGGAVSLLALIDAYLPESGPAIDDEAQLERAFARFSAAEAQTGAGRPAGPNVDAGGSPLARRLRHLGAPAGAADSELEAMFAVYRRHLRVLNAEAVDPHPIRSVHYVAAREPDATRTEARWSDLLGGEALAQLVDADHFGLLRPPAVDEIGRDLALRLQAGAESPANRAAQRAPTCR
jgi:amino acid adenylation domain-containing protein